MRRLAWKRFILGYPPRKKNDTSTGDAINWEWIVACVKKSKRDVIIVSRDSDYGEFVDGAGYINDWLLQELKERTTNRRQISLHDRLSTALKKLDIEITSDEEADEESTIRLELQRKNVTEDMREPPLSKEALQELLCLL